MELFPKKELQIMLSDLFDKVSLAVKYVLWHDKYLPYSTKVTTSER